MARLQLLGIHSCSGERNVVVIVNMRFIVYCVFFFFDKMEGKQEANFQGNKEVTSIN